MIETKFVSKKDGNQYLNAVFNETVSIVELDEGLDGETFFLYVFLAAVVVLVAVVSQQFFVSFGVSFNAIEFEFNI
jgi:translocon-associated protein subunit alpha